MQHAQSTAEPQRQCELEQHAGKQPLLKTEFSNIHTWVAAAKPTHHIYLNTVTTCSCHADECQKAAVELLYTLASNTCERTTTDEAPIRFKSASRHPAFNKVICVPTLSGCCCCCCLPGVLCSRATHLSCTMKMRDMNPQTSAWLPTMATFICRPTLKVLSLHSTNVSQLAGLVPRAGYSTTLNLLHSAQ